MNREDHREFIRGALTAFLGSSTGILVLSLWNYEFTDTYFGLVLMLSIFVYIGYRVYWWSQDQE